MNNNWTTEDEFNPVYCLSCKEQVPILISNQNKGYCDNCVVRMQKPPIINPTPKPLQPNIWQTYFSPKIPVTNKARGVCPQCRSRNICDISDHQMVDSFPRHGSALILVGVLTICFFFGWILIALGIFISIIELFFPKYKFGVSSRACLDCGHQWPI